MNTESIPATTSEVSLKEFMLLAVLWLPLAFVFWFLFSPIIVTPTAMIVDSILAGFWPDQFGASIVSGHDIDIGIKMQLAEVAAQSTDGRVAMPVVTYNPLIYGYGLPLMAGLALAAPTSLLQKALHIVIGFVVVTGIMVWGVVFEVFKDLSLKMGEPGLAIMEHIDLSTELIAFCYQFGYLVFPGVIPAILWVLLNRAFIEGLVFGRPAQADR